MILIVGGLTWMSLKRKASVQKTGKGKPFSALQNFSMESAREFAPESAPYQQKSEPGKVSRSPAGFWGQKITALVRDPYWIFAFWEKGEFQESWRDSRPVLRVYANGDFQEISINEDADNWYINVERPGTTFWVEIGRLFPDNLYILLSRSNKVTTPRDRVSEIIDEEWLLLAEKEKELYERMTFTSSPSSPEVVSSPVK
jgi:hypothetical protein